MSEVWNSMKEHFLLFSIYEISLIFVFISIIYWIGKDKKNRAEETAFVLVTGILFLLIFPPVTYFFMNRCQITDYYSLFLMIPAVSIMGYLFVEVYRKQTQLSKKIVLWISIPILLLANTALSLTYQSVDIRLNVYGIDQDVVHLADTMKEYGITNVLVTQNFESQVTKYTYSFLFYAEPLEYSQDSYEGILSNEQEVMNNVINLSTQNANDEDENTSPAQPYGQFAIDYGYIYVVLDETCDDENMMTSLGFQILAKEGNYTLYYYG